jgi:hypothetical protein
MIVCGTSAAMEIAVPAKLLAAFSCPVKVFVDQHEGCQAHTEVIGHVHLLKVRPEALRRAIAFLEGEELGLRLGATEIGIQLLVNIVGISSTAHLLSIPILQRAILDLLWDILVDR